MKSELETIGKRIRQIRKKSGLTQGGLGEKLGVGHTAVSDYENDNTNPSPDSLVKIAEIGNVTLDWLITGKELEKPATPTTPEQALAIAVHHPDVLKIIRDGLIKEEFERYGGERRQIALSDEERILIENYRAASDKIKRAAFNMLNDDAQESRRNDDGGGLGSTAENCG